VVTEWAYSYADTRTDANALRVDWDALNRLYLPLNVIGWFWWCAHDNQHTGDLPQKVRPLIPTLEEYNLSARFTLEPPTDGVTMHPKQSPDFVGYVSVNFGLYKKLTTYTKAWEKVSEEWRGRGDSSGDPKYNYQAMTYVDGKQGLCAVLRPEANNGKWGVPFWVVSPF
jgi:hypothetical protein